MNDRPLDKKFALITGASRGIGRALAIAYAQAGAIVACTARSQTDLEDTVATIVEAGGQAFALPCDATDENQVKAMILEIEARLDRLDIVFLNAGGTVGNSDPIASSNFQDWKRTIEINLSTAFLVARESLPLLRLSSNPKILTMGSGMGRKPQAGSSAYSCAKAALGMFTQALAMELLDEGIAVNELIPGPVSTGLFKTDQTEPHLISEGHFKGEFFKSPEDVIPLAMFLASQPKHGPSGQTFSLNRRLL